MLTGQRPFNISGIQLATGEVASPINPRPGCRFASRCPYAKDKCHSELPPVKEVQGISVHVIM